MRSGAVRTAAVAVPAVLVPVCITWGRHLQHHGRMLALDAPPFVGMWVHRWGARTVLPVLVAAVVILVGPTVARACSWRWLLAGSFGVAVAWSVALAATDGRAGFTAGVRSHDDYLHDVARVHDVTGFLSSFTSYVNTFGGPHPWTTHVSGHPPGFLLLLGGLDHVGLGGAWPEIVLLVAAGCLAPAAVLVTVREVVDEGSARSAAPFLVLMPAAIWVAVSADALFLAVSAWGIAALAVGSHRCSDRLALAGGLLLGASLMLTYGLLTLGLLAAAVVLVTRRVRPLVIAGIGVAAVLGVFAVLGFWWFDGLHETLIRYRAGAGGYRPYGYFLVADLVVLAVSVGPATMAGLTALGRRDRLWWIVGPALLAVLAADVSGDSKAEVERIWLPFAPWLVLGTARLPHPRLWLALQAVVAIGVQSTLLSKW